MNFYQSLKHKPRFEDRRVFGQFSSEEFCCGHHFSIVVQVSIHRVLKSILQYAYQHILHANCSLYVRLGCTTLFVARKRFGQYSKCGLNAFNPSQVQCMLGLFDIGRATSLPNLRICACACVPFAAGFVPSVGELTSRLANVA